MKITSHLSEGHLHLIDPRLLLRLDVEKSVLFNGDKTHTIIPAHTIRSSFFINHSLANQNEKIRYATTIHAFKTRSFPGIWRFRSNYPIDAKFAGD